MVEEKVLFPVSRDYFNDFEEIFSIQQEERLEKLISNYEKETIREIAIITVKSIEPYENIREYAMAISNDWEVGKEETSNGLTILMCTELKSVCITTWLRFPKTLTDDICKKVIPEFKNGNYYRGVEKGALEMMKKGIPNMSA
ncbi:TPM domain-containing protein [Gramella sp. GC03-9]|uniref:TPM domain-containing protein n=1 Tax=Christiangramia oceanisediminis TaxID=2920386 RepID=A0A9X2I672_9FLAO|nr:TPM domain-containing protein [Gramella oceanisediminis]MCP9198624.1 TPM domain-containing protein [Gramella oceanisediminis]